MLEQNYTAHNVSFDSNSAALLTEDDAVLIDLAMAAMFRHAAGITTILFIVSIMALMLIYHQRYSENLKGINWGCRTVYRNA
jgi:hypothetical protein